MRLPFEQLPSIDSNLYEVVTVCNTDYLGKDAKKRAARNWIAKFSTLQSLIKTNGQYNELC